MTWYGPRGESLLITYLVPFDTTQTNPAGLLSMAGGVAVADAISNLTGLEPRLRWPNDVLLPDKKVAGILTEVFPVRSDARPPLMVAALGIGLNVNIGQWPDALGASATSLRLRTGRPWPVELIEAAVRTSLRPCLGLLAGSEPKSIVERWRTFDASIGRNYMLAEGTQPEVVRAVAINDAGFLMVRTGTGRQFPVVSARHTSES